MSVTLTADPAAGAVLMASGATPRAAHGGIFVFFAVRHVLSFILALVVGTDRGRPARGRPRGDRRPSYKLRPGLNR